MALPIPYARSATHFVNPSNSTPVSPYTDWSTAATNIQDAVNVASAGETVLVTNGMFNTGVQLASDGTQNRLTLTNSIIVTSVNGSTNTTIDGGNVTRCVFLTNGARIDGFTLTHGTAGFGGGAFCASTNEVISDCQLLNNLANGGQGGGVYGGIVTNCMLSGNTATGPPTVNIGGGAASQSFLINCSLVNNKTPGGVVGFGGAARFCTLINCVINNNSVDQINGDGGGVANSTAYHCTFSGNRAEYGGAADNTRLYNCTISGNSGSPGGGTSSCELYSCIVSGNTYGGCWRSTLYNCILTGNQGGDGGGAYQSYLYNCTVTGNSAVYGGGVDSCIVMNSIVYNNTTSWMGPNYYATQFDGPMTLNYCCTAPLPTTGVGNISVDPLFVNAGSGDIHLQSGSLCINSGYNTYVNTNVDYDNNPRIRGGTVDIGAYEFQTPSSGLSYAWAQEHGLPTDGSADSQDPDRDGMNNWQEWIAGTDPFNVASVLRIAAISNNPPGLQITWQSVSGKTYYLQRATNLSIQPAFSSIRSNITGQATNTSVNDSTATDQGPYFYRVGVQN
ncbi:MAG TPA: choice-of-anchor Q domain-containing protein [Verrucomicrobiae bacterium]|nr:choice-of-anchor Q domain-containing protein [Verrucomicrobiae bacterium]